MSDTPAASELVLLKDAGSLFPARSGGRFIHKNTLYRWANVGIRGHRLRVTRVGRFIYTSPAWVEEFLAGCSALDVAN